MKSLEENIAAAKKELAQAKNRLKVLENRERDAERRERTHRLIERGAILESLVPELDKLTNEQVRELLAVAVNTGEVKRLLRTLGLP